MTNMNKSTTIERQKRIVEILTLLHEGGMFEDAKKIFNEEFDGVDVSEITGAEKALIQGGSIPLKFKNYAMFMQLSLKGLLQIFINHL